MDEKKVYTLDDVARELNVSKTTVSRAISGKGRISAETRKRVLDFIDEHEYRPNLMAKGLAQNKTYNIALVLPLDYAVTDFPFFKDCMHGICFTAAEHDYDLIVTMAEGDDLAQIQRIVLNRKVDGVIVSRSVENSKVVQYLKEKKMPLVVIGPCDDREIAFVDNDNKGASCELTQKMLEKGFQKLALLGGRRSYGVTKSRYDGFAAAYQRIDQSIDRDFVFWDIDSKEQVKMAVDTCIDRGADCIICMDDHICSMLLSYLREIHVSVPDQICVASLYDNKFFEEKIPTITAVRFDTMRLGKAACLKLISLLGENTEKEEEVLGYEVFIRQSTQ